MIGWVVYAQVTARKQGVPAPSLKSWKTYVPFLRSQGSSNYPAPRHASPLEWIRDQFSRLTNKRTARGAYEEAGGETGLVGGGRRGRGVEDDAWDTRVGNEDPYSSGPGGYAGYEEQELGLAPTPGLHNEPYGGGSGSGAGADYLDVRGGGGRGRPGSSSRENNPFGDQNEAPSLRSISPRPDQDGGHGQHIKGNLSLDSAEGGNSSPTSTRKSVFREGI